MSSKPLVSVVVPAYQNVAYIARTLDSVLAQTYDRLEVVVADHSSRDGTWELLQRYAHDKRVVLLRTPPGGGAERNWNRVTEAATGTYLKLVCGDDVMRPTCVEDQVAALQAHPEAVLAACRRDLIDAKDRILLRGRGLPRMSGLVSGADAVRASVRAGVNIFGEPVCVLLRRELVDVAGGWSAQQPYLIDQDLYVKVLRHGDLFADPRALAAFRISDSQWSVELARQQAGQAASFHRRVRAMEPSLVSDADVLMGNARAAVASLKRRAAYAVWARRMRPAAGAA